jgi:hypothetical protein
MGKDLINKLLKKNPLYRYTIRSALEHPWITMNKFDKIPLTIYDKANIDENVERLKLFLLVAIFLNYSKKDNLFMNDNPKDKKISNNFEDISDDTNLDYENGNFSKNKKVKSMKQIRNRKKFDMKEYEKMVKNSNKIYHLKFIEDREIMFNPKLSSKNQVKNINDLSSIIKRIKQNQSKEDCSTMFLENSTIRKKSKNFDYLQKSSSNKKLLFNDEQKNSETLEQPNYSKMKTPFKLKNSFLDTSRTIIQKTKLKRRFSAMPKVLNKGNNEEYIWNKMTKREKGTSIIRNLKNDNLDIIQNKKKELDFKLFSKRIEKSKKLRTNSAKNVNMYYHAVDRSVNINNKNRKWHLPFKKENLVKNNFPLLNKGYNINNKTLKKKLEKQIMDVKILLNNKEKEKIILKKKTSILSVTEHTQNSISEFKNSKKNFPIIL